MPPSLGPVPGTGSRRLGRRSLVRRLQGFENGAFAVAVVSLGADGAIVVADVHGAQVAPSGDVVTQVIKVRVEDVDAAFVRARDAGARVLQEPETYTYGERSCLIADPAGHRWELTQSVRDVDPAEWGGVGSW